jgi:hypothetical protein
MEAVDRNFVSAIVVLKVVLAEFEAVHEEVQAALIQQLVQLILSGTNICNQINHV